MDPSVAPARANGTDEITEVVESENPFYHGRATGGKVAKNRRRATFQPYSRTNPSVVQVASKRLSEGSRQNQFSAQTQGSGQARGWKAWGWGLAVKAVETGLKHVWASGSTPRITAGSAIDANPEPAHVTNGDLLEVGDGVKDQVPVSADGLVKKEKLLQTLALKVSREEFLQLTELLNASGKEGEKEEMQVADGKETRRSEGARLSQHLTSARQLSPTRVERLQTSLDRMEEKERQDQSREELLLALRNSTPGEQRLQLDRKVGFRIDQETEARPFGSPLVPLRSEVPELEDGEEIRNLAIEHMSRGSMGNWRETPAGSRVRSRALTLSTTPQLSPGMTPPSNVHLGTQRRLPSRWTEMKPSGSTPEFGNTPVQPRWTPLRTPVTGGRELLKRRASTALIDDGWSTGGPIRRTRLRQSGAAGFGGWRPPHSVGEDRMRVPRQMAGDSLDRERQPPVTAQRRGAVTGDDADVWLDSRALTRGKRDARDGLQIVPSHSRSTADKILSQLDALSPTSDKGWVVDALGKTGSPRELEEQRLGQRAQRSMLRVEPPPPLDLLDAGGHGVSRAASSARDKAREGVTSPVENFPSPTGEEYHMTSKAIQDVAGRAKGKAMAFVVKPSSAVAASAGPSRDIHPSASADVDRPNRDSGATAAAPPKKSVGFRMTAFLDEGGSDDEGKSQRPAETASLKLGANEALTTTASGSSPVFSWAPATSGGGQPSSAFSFQAPSKQGVLPAEEPATPRAMPSGSLFGGSEEGGAEAAATPTFSFGAGNGEPKISSFPGALNEKLETQEQPKYEFGVTANGRAGDVSLKPENNHFGSSSSTQELMKQPTEAPKASASFISFADKPAEGSAPTSVSPSTAPSLPSPTLLSFLQPKKPEAPNSQSEAADSTRAADALPSTSTALSRPVENLPSSEFKWQVPAPTSTAASTASFVFGAADSKPAFAAFSPHPEKAPMPEAHKEATSDRRDEGDAGERAAKRQFGRQFGGEDTTTPSSSAMFSVPGFGSTATLPGSSSMPGTSLAVASGAQPIIPSTSHAAAIFPSAPSLQTISAPASSMSFPTFGQTQPTTSSFNSPAVPTTGIMRFGAVDTLATKAPSDTTPSFGKDIPAASSPMPLFGTTAPAFGNASTATSLFGIPQPILTPGTMSSPAPSATAASPSINFTFGTGTSSVAQTSSTFNMTPPQSFAASAVPKMEFGASSSAMFNTSAAPAAFGSGAASSSAQFSAPGAIPFAASTGLFNSTPSTTTPVSTTPSFSFTAGAASAPAPTPPQFVFGAQPQSPSPTPPMFGGFATSSTPFGCANGAMGPSGTGSGSPNTAMEDSMSEEPGAHQQPNTAGMGFNVPAQPLSSPFGGGMGVNPFANGSFGTAPQASGFTFGAVTAPQPAPQFDGTFGAGGAGSGELNMGSGPPPMFNIGGGGTDAKTAGRKVVKVKRSAKRGGR